MPPPSPVQLPISPTPPPPPLACPGCLNWSNCKAELHTPSPFPFHSLKVARKGLPATWPVVYGRSGVCMPVRGYDARGVPLPSYLPPPPPPGCMQQQPHFLTPFSVHLHLPPRIHSYGVPLLILPPRICTSFGSCHQTPKHLPAQLNQP